MISSCRVFDLAFPPAVPCLLLFLFLAAVSPEGASCVVESFPCLSTVGFASRHPALVLLPPPCPPWTHHRMVVPRGEHPFHPQIQGLSVCTEVEEHPRPLALQDKFAFQHQDLLHKQEGKILAWGRKCHKYMLFKWFMPKRHMSASLKSHCAKLNC